MPLLDNMTKWNHSRVFEGYILTFVSTQKNPNTAIHFFRSAEKNEKQDDIATFFDYYAYLLDTIIH